MKLIFNILLIIFFLSASAQENIPRVYKRLTAAQVFNKLAEEPETILLDVRVYRLYRNSRIPLSVNASTPQEVDSLLQHIANNQFMIVYSNSDALSFEVVKYFWEKKFDRFIVLDGGIKAWLLAGFTLDKTKLPRKRESE